MIKTENLTKIYYSGKTKVEALKDVSLEIEDRKCTLIQGPSGSGKTTLLNIIGCLTKPTRGRIWIDGREIAHFPDQFLTGMRRERIGFIFQQFNLLSGYTVLQNVGMPLVPLGISEKRRDERALEILRKLNLENRADFRINELSGGEQQRISIARALINEPQILLADEPNSNIDQKTSLLILDIFKGLKKAGKTLIIATHDPFLIGSGIADRAFTLSGGRLEK